jgi:hypothetical protein
MTASYLCLTALDYVLISLFFLFIAANFSWGHRTAVSSSSDAGHPLRHDGDRAEVQMTGGRCVGNATADWDDASCQRRSCHPTSCLPRTNVLPSRRREYSPATTTSAAATTTAAAAASRGSFSDRFQLSERLNQQHFASLNFADFFAAFQRSSDLFSQLKLLRSCLAAADRQC